MGSRSSLCINDAVREKGGGSVEALNERCLDLQKAGKAINLEIVKDLSLSLCRERQEMRVSAAC